jgi:hypothetical protein
MRYFPYFVGKRYEDKKLLKQNLKKWDLKKWDVSVGWIHLP